ncbi:apolipoprotein N-acyltransferase [Aeoliella mucimassa]|uniref:Apolipoprotein N-acyltransferase n=1 Tax=Aeoliella mucimassa TaxID=2527972 RepID=A0A518AHC9_9BACT|nr:apolipoprotein N-acyltransferase [Aeoliella mucimassa]QDU54140.1 Apolipoprotein N-acyltransferase [Aeoliella mucimassa]
MPAESDDCPPPVPRSRTLLVALTGSVLLWLAQPPVGWSLCAWVAPLPWLYLATKPVLMGRRDYLKIWLAGAVYWMLAVHWIRLAHPATIVGLFFLAGYLGIYLPLFIAATRMGGQRLRMPLCLVAPMAWVAIEWLEAHVISGFLMGALSHTQVDHAPLVQIADLAGAYLVSALIMLVASCLWELVAVQPVVRRRLEQSELPVVSCCPPGVRVIASLILAVCAVSASWWYGQWRLAQLAPADDAMPKRLALIQGNERAVWVPDPGREQRVMETYLRLTAEAKQKSADGELDLVVWPEGAFRTPLYSCTPEVASTIGAVELMQMESAAPGDLQRTVEDLGAPILVGCDRFFHHGTEGSMQQQYQVFNAAVAVDRQGELLGIYDKTHLVMFGEYVPGGTYWPGIYNFFPIGGVTPGELPVVFDIEGTRYMPTICYETVMPHVVRRQVVQLADAEQRPDVLVNVTNDSWFYDSSELAMHLTCTRLRAIECRTPVVVAANGGLSANIDVAGRVLDLSQPVTNQVLLVDVQPGGHASLYLRYGDTFAIACLAGTVLVFVVGIIQRRLATQS